MMSSLMTRACPSFSLNASIFMMSSLMTRACPSVSLNVSIFMLSSPMTRARPSFSRNASLFMMSSPTTRARPSFSLKCGFRPPFLCHHWWAHRRLVHALSSVWMSLTQRSYFPLIQLMVCTYLPPSRNTRPSPADFFCIVIHQRRTLGFAMDIFTYSPAKTLHIIYFLYHLITHWVHMPYLAMQHSELKEEFMDLHIYTYIHTP